MTDPVQTCSLAGIRVIEVADEQAEYVGLMMASLGAEVIKVEPRGGSPTRGIGPFVSDVEDTERSLYFWQYNRGKRSIVLDLEESVGRIRLMELLATADVFLESTPRGYLDGLGLGRSAIAKRFGSLVTARMTPFGDDGPWADYKGSDLVHLALGGEMMCCGYDPRPDGTYDLPPIAGQMWHAYHIAGEQLAMGILAALFHRARTGVAQHVAVAVHDAVAKNTEIDVMSWVMLRTPIFRQICAHARDRVAAVPPIVATKDGRWFMLSLIGARDRAKLVPFLERYGMAGDLIAPVKTTDLGARVVPGAGSVSEEQAHVLEVVQRLFRKFTYADAPWREAQEAGLMCIPLRRPEENVDDEHWRLRGTYREIEHSEVGRSFTYVTSKWISTETAWRVGRRAPLLNEDEAAIVTEVSAASARSAPARVAPSAAPRFKPPRRASALEGIRVFDFSWFLASAGGTRFLSSMGAEVIKVEWSAHPDTRVAVMAPVGGREARRMATGPLQGVTDPDMGGQFKNKNAGKRGISLNVRHPQGLQLARRLIAMSDVVAEGFSPGVMDSWGLGYDALREIKANIIYAQQSGMGARGTYGRFRAIGPIAASLAGTTEMSGLAEPALPAGWGYSYLDWIGAYSFANAVLSALFYREKTGKGQWIDASQTEAGIFVGGTAVLDYSVNGRAWRRYGNRSPWKKAAPHGAYRCAGTDRWLAIGCFTDDEWGALTMVAGHPEWRTDARFASLGARLENQDALDEAITSWTAAGDRYDLMHALQSVGVSAGVCQNAEDKCEADPQLAALEWLTEVTGTKIGTWPIYEVPIKMSQTPPSIGGRLERGAPNYGEDNEYVYGELLGMSGREMERLSEAGVI